MYTIVCDRHLFILVQKLANLCDHPATCNALIAAILTDEPCEKEYCNCICKCKTHGTHRKYFFDGLLALSHVVFKCKHCIRLNHAQSIHLVK